MELLVIKLRLYIRGMKRKCLSYTRLSNFLKENCAEIDTDKVIRKLMDEGIIYLNNGYYYCYGKDVKKGMKTILDNIALLKNGISVCVFPEGTRNRTSASLLEFHDGSLKMAEKSGCPIVPMAINNSGAIFEDHLPKIVKSHVVIEYCDPIYMEDLSKEEKRFIGKQVADIIVTHYEKNKELV